LCVVAKFGMCVQGQVVCDQVDVVLQQTLQTLLHPTRDGAVLAAPKQTVVHQDRVGLGVDRRIDQSATRRHARDQVRNVRAPFDLQTVGAIVFEFFGLQHAVQGGEQIAAMDAWGGQG